MREKKSLGKGGGLSNRFKAQLDYSSHHGICLNMKPRELMQYALFNSQRFADDTSDKNKQTNNNTTKAHKKWNI